MSREATKAGTARTQVKAHSTKPNSSSFGCSEDIEGKQACLQILTQDSHHRTPAEALGVSSLLCGAESMLSGAEGFGKTESSFNAW